MGFYGNIVPASHKAKQKHMVLVTYDFKLGLVGRPQIYFFSKLLYLKNRLALIGRLTHNKISLIQESHGNTSNNVNVRKLCRFLTLTFCGDPS